MHRRKAIRDAVVAGLAAAPEILALVPPPTVEASRWIALDPAAMPRILVYLRGERVDGYLTLAPREYKILADLVIEYVATNVVTDGPGEDALDAVAEALEKAIDRLETDNLGDLVREFEYQGTDVEVGDRTERATVSLAMRYQLELGRVVAPEILDDFKTAAVEYLTGDAQADDPTDTVTLPII